MLKGLVGRNKNNVHNFPLSSVLAIAQKVVAAAFEIAAFSESVQP